MFAGIQLRPKVAPVGREARLVLRDAGANPVLEPNRRYGLRLYSKVNRTESVDFEAVADAQGALTAVRRLDSAGEYVLEVRRDGEDAPFVRQPLFAVRTEWAGLRPFRGDLHMHTTGSDGKASATAMARRAREVGNDFIAITDHDNREPSLQAADEARRSGLNLTVLAGEEVTVREIGGHILSLGASACVGRLCWQPECDAGCRRIVEEELAGRALVPPLTAPQYAYAVWAVRAIHRLGGQALIAHPYWVGTKGTYYPPRCLVDQLLADRLCDGIELLGGSPTSEGNRLAIACYAEQAARGFRLPVVGGSDAHGEAGLSGSYWTVAFAREAAAVELLDAVAARRTVACDGRNGADVAIYGPLDLVEYAYFLQREFFPLHDELCRTGRESELAALYGEFGFVRGGGADPAVPFGA